jgi:hypothetical protein
MQNTSQQTFVGSNQVFFPERSTRLANLTHHQAGSYFRKINGGRFAVPIAVFHFARVKPLLADSSCIHLTFDVPVLAHCHTAFPSYYWVE